MQLPPEDGDFEMEEINQQLEVSQDHQQRGEQQSLIGNGAVRERQQPEAPELYNSISAIDSSNPNYDNSAILQNSPENEAQNSQIVLDYQDFNGAEMVLASSAEFPNENILVDDISSPSEHNVSLSSINLEEPRRLRAQELNDQGDQIHSGSMSLEA